jgi:hypothetical protein
LPPAAAALFEHHVGNGKSILFVCSVMSICTVLSVEQLNSIFLNKVSNLKQLAHPLTSKYIYECKKRKCRLAIMHVFISSPLENLIKNLLAAIGFTLLIPVLEFSCNA